MNTIKGLFFKSALTVLAITAHFACANFSTTVYAQELESMEETAPVFEEDTSMASSSDVAVGGEVFMSVASKYIWRGLEINEKPVFQGDASLSAGSDAMGSFTAGVWGNMDLRNEYDNAWEFTEVDIYGDYTKSIDIVSLSVGAIYYHFPNSDLPGTTEIYGGVGLDVPLSPALTVYYDIDEVEGFYVTADIGHEIEVSEQVSFGLGLTAGFMDDDHAEFYYGVDDGGFSNVDLSAELACAFTDNIGGSLGVVGTVVPDSDMRDAVDDPDNVYGIAGLSFSF